MLGQQIGGEASAYAGAGTGIQGVWGSQYNQAGLAGVEGLEVGVFLENRFLVAEMANGGGAIAHPLGNGVLAFSFNTFGYSAYHTGKYGLAYAKKLGEKLNLGVQIDYRSAVIGEGYGKSSTFMIEGGFQYNLTDQLMMTGHVSNPSRAKLSEYNNERIPTMLKGGVKYDFSEKVFLVAELWKDIDSKEQFRAGVEYRMVEFLTLRGGMGTNPSLVSFGFSLNWKNTHVDFASSYHTVLGFSPSISLSYRAK